MARDWLAIAVEDDEPRARGTLIDSSNEEFGENVLLAGSEARHARSLRLALRHWLGVC